MRYQAALRPEAPAVLRYKRFRLSANGSRRLRLPWTGRPRAMLTLYYAPGASSMAPHIALFETGAAFEGRPLSFKKAENRTAEYLAINPLGQAPTLVIDGRPLTEVAAILFYLARTYPDAGLLP